MIKPSLKPSLVLAVMASSWLFSETRLKTFAGCASVCEFLLIVQESMNPASPARSDDLRDADLA